VNRRVRDREGRPAARCSRNLADQLVGPAVVRRGEHPRQLVRRLDLLTDAEIDQLRRRSLDGGARAFLMFEALDEQLEAALIAMGLSDDLVRQRVDRKPLLAVWACLECGAVEVGRADRSWAVEDAMRRARLGEREVLAIERLLAEAWAGASPPSIDKLPTSALEELAVLVDADVDLDAVRARVGALLSGTAPGPGGGGSL
jgi:hypothetical protein